MSLIQVSNLTFGYDGSPDLIFKNVSFQIDTDWKLGFTGRNGRGKTTFLNLLMGKHEYAGTISSSVPFDYFPFPVAAPERDTIEIMEEIVPDCPHWKVERELSLLQVAEDVPYRPFSTLSGGERTKVLLAALFLKEENFLLIDEPTNHLDADARMTVGRYLNSKKGFLLVSHDRVLLDSCIDHILSINRQNIEIQKGNFSSWQANKERRDSFELDTNEKLKKEITQLSQSAKQAAQWSDRVEKTKHSTRNSGLRPDRGYIGHKSAKMMQRSRSIEARKEKAAEEKSGLLKNIETAEALKLHPLTPPKQVLVEARGLSVCYDGKAVFEPLDFTVNSGDRVLLSGRNGCGKSSVLKLLAGQEIPHTGTLQTAGGLILSYVPQDSSFLKGGLREYAEKQRIDESLLKSILRKLDFSREQFEKELSQFSEGQKKKVLLAASLCQSAHLYLWDEPLNFIDVLARMQLEEVILQYRPTMIFVEHDLSFQNRIATKRVAF